MTEHNSRAEDIVRKYADLIYRAAYQNLQSRADAEDIFSEVCLVVLTKNPPEDSEEHLRKWLITVTLNKCRNLRKSWWRTRVDSIEEHLDIPSTEENREVMEELKQLPVNYRNVIYLYYYEEYTIAEIGEILGKSPNTVSTWLRRARKKLKDILEE